MKTNLPRWTEELLANCPGTGKGVHRFLFRAALSLHRHCADKEEIAQLLSQATNGCGREVPAREIDDAIRDSQRVIDEEATGAPKLFHRWPSRNEELIQSIVSGGPKLVDLQASSPVRWNDDKPHTEEVIDKLFPGNPLLCAGLKNTKALTRSREEWRGFLQNQQFIVASAMSSQFGLTKNGDQSMRTLNNVGPRCFVVVEFDQGVFDEHAALLVHLRKYAPLALVVHSGGKSLHGWFPCAGLPEERVEKFFRYAVSLGADHMIWTRCQFVRMPDGLRENGNRQRVMYFDPENLEQSI
jgi:hypothetical protein